MKKIAIFDMDGTLIDSAHDITQSINYVRNNIYGLHPMENRHIVEAINASKRNLAKIFYETDIYENRAKELFEEHYYDQCIQNVRAYEGISELLEQLRIHGVHIGVATNAPSLFAKRMLSHLKLSDHFSLIVGADMVETPKPHPQMLQMILELHRFEKGTDHAWMIGDNEKDLEAAERAGISGIFAKWGFGSASSYEHGISHPSELAGFIL